MSLIEYFSQTHNSDELKELLDVMGVRGKPTRKDERAELLVRTLTSRRELQDLLDRMRDVSAKHWLPPSTRQYLRSTCVPGAVSCSARSPQWGALVVFDKTLHPRSLLPGDDPLAFVAALCYPS
ncbi:MAG: hypothetical protein R2856_26820 [Caldilineaceae bacterium]